MKKTIRILVLGMLIAALCGLSVAQAEIIPPLGYGQIGLSAVVLCDSLTVRERPSSSADAVEKLEYGYRFIVMEQKDGWAYIATSDDVDAGPVGWVNADYIAIDPAWYVTDEKTPVYAWDDKSAPKVALLGKNTTVPILKDDGSWLVISLRGAAGWIRK